MISFDYSWFLAKKYSNFVTLPWKLHNRYCRRLKLKLNDPPKNACALQLQPLIFLWDTAYFFWPLHFLDWYPLKLEMDHLKECDICLHCIAFYDLGLHDYTIAYCWCCINKPLRFTMGSTSSFDSLNDTLEMPEEGAGGQFPAQFLADQLTLFQPGPGADYAHHITTSPPDFWTVRRLCDNIINLLVVIRIRTDGRSKNLVEGAMSCLFYFCPVRRKLGRLLLPTPASIGSGN